MVIFVSSEEILLGTIIMLILIIGAIIYRINEKEDDYEDRKH